MCFNPEVAQMYGVDGAIMLHHLAFWVYRNKLNENNEIDGYTWTWNSARAFTEIFPFWTNTQIRRILTSLEKKGAILSAVHNRARWDRTKWYTVTEKVQCLYHYSKQANAFEEIVPSKSRKKQMDVTKSSHPYHIVTTDSNQIVTSLNKEIVFPFENKKFLESWIIWKDERVLKGKDEFTNRGEQAALHELQTMSNNDYKTAIKIINHAISEGWRGLYPLKSKGKHNTTPQEFDKDKLLNHLEQTRNT